MSTAGNFVVWGALAILLCFPQSAQALLVISSKPTKNLVCSDGVCTATANNAVLNGDQLAGMLNTSHVTVQSGSAIDIRLDTVVTWTTVSRLTLESSHSIEIAKQLTVAGPGAITLTTGNGGSLQFPGSGHVVFWDLGSSLAINGIAYTLVNSISTLASAIRAHPGGHYALANSYDASADGTYRSSPIHKGLAGSVEGLGNSISNLKVHSGANATAPYLGLFEQTCCASTINNLRLRHAHFETEGSMPRSMGLLVGDHGGSLSGDIVDGSIRAHCCTVGGMVGQARGKIVHSSATVRIDGNPSQAGGLAGFAPGLWGGSIRLSNAHGNVQATGSAGGLVGTTYDGFQLSQDFATGAVSGGTAGGLVGFSQGLVENSYALGSVTGTGGAGGFAGANDVIYRLAHNYAIGPIDGGPHASGGFIGCDYFPPTSTYWDTDTAGVGVGNGCAAAYEIDDVVGLTTIQFQSGLPAGFDPAIWAEDPNINGGFPYLKANPPQ